MLRILTATTTAASQEEARADADAAFDAAFGEGGYDVRATEVGPAEAEVDKAASEAAGERVVVTTLWQGKFTAVRKGD